MREDVCPWWKGRRRRRERGWDALEGGGGGAATEDECAGGLRPPVGIARVSRPELLDGEDEVDMVEVGGWSKDGKGGERGRSMV